MTDNKIVVPIVLDPEGARIVIGEATVNPDGTVDAVLDEVEYTGVFRGQVHGFSIIPDTFRSVEDGRVSG